MTTKDKTKPEAGSTLPATKGTKAALAEITWTTIQVRLGDIQPWASNPRQSTKKQAERISKSFKKWGQAQTIAVSPSLRLLDGHQRRAALIAQYGEDHIVDARQSSRELTEEERQEFVVTLHTGAVGQYDFDILSSFDPGLLQANGFDQDLLDQLNLEQAAIIAMLGQGAADGDAPGTDENYSRKIEAPIYKPSGPKPAVAALFDDSATRKKIAEIDAAADIPDDVRAFLRVAAQRHTIINFKNVAEFYAHSPAPVQRLFENSALVIIDFNRAIELGFVTLTDQMREIVALEEGSDD